MRKENGQEEVVELSIRVSNSEKATVTKHLVYEPMSLSKKDPVLSHLVDQAVKEFKSVMHDVDDVVIKIKMVWD